MSRVSESEVKEIINTSLTDSEVTPFINAASNVVTAKCSSAGYSDDELLEIERWLAAHLISIREPTRSAVSRKQIGEASESYNLLSPVGNQSILGGTPYGQQVLLLDYEGCLVDLGKRRTMIAGIGVTNEEFD
jgi:hypothetical protein